MQVQLDPLAQTLWDGAQVCVFLTMRFAQVILSVLNFEDAAPTPNQATVGRGIVKGAEKKPQGQITSSLHPSRTCFQKEGTSGDPAPLPPPAGGEGATEAQPTLLAEEREAVVAMAAH